MYRKFIKLEEAINKLVEAQRRIQLSWERLSSN